MIDEGGYDDPEEIIYNVKPFNSEPIDLDELFNLMTQPVSKSQMRRLAIQTAISEEIEIVVEMQERIATLTDLMPEDDGVVFVEVSSLNHWIDEVKQLHSEVNWFEKVEIKLLQNETARLQTENNLLKEYIEAYAIEEQMSDLPIWKSETGEYKMPQPSDRANALAAWNIVDDECEDAYKFLVAAHKRVFTAEHERYKAWKVVEAFDKGKEL